MRSFLAALRTLVLPYGAVSGQRIVLDGVNGKIEVYDASNNLIASVTADDSFRSILPNAVPSLQNEAQLTGASLKFLRTDPGDIRTYFQDGQIGMSTDGVAFATLSWGLDTDVWSTNKPIHIQGETWTNLTLGASWVADTGANLGSTPSYKRLANGNVQMRGWAKNGTTAATTLIATLPVNYRPVANSYFVCAMPNSNTNQATLSIESDGQIRIASMPAATFSFDNISFPTS